MNQAASAVHRSPAAVAGTGLPAGAAAGSWEETRQASGGWRGACTAEQHAWTASRMMSPAGDIYRCMHLGRPCYGGQAWLSTAGGSGPRQAVVPQQRTRSSTACQVSTTQAACLWGGPVCCWRIGALLPNIWRGLSGRRYMVLCGGLWYCCLSAAGLQLCRRGARCSWYPPGRRCQSAQAGSTH